MKVTRLKHRLSIWLLVLPLAAAGPAHAQDGANADGRTAEALLTGTRPTPPPPRPRRCNEPAAGEEITVCAPDKTQFRMQSTTDSDPMSRTATRTGIPHPPELGRGSCRGKFGCLIGGGAPSPLYIIDLKAIPEAPAGTDADKVAKGQMSDR